MRNEILKSTGINISAVHKGSIILELTVESWENALSILDDTKSSDVQEKIKKYILDSGLLSKECDLLEIFPKVAFKSNVSEKTAGKVTSYYFKVIRNFSNRIRPEYNI